MLYETAEEMSPSGGEQAGQIGMVINEVFRAPMPAAPRAGLVTLLEGLQYRWLPVLYGDRSGPTSQECG
jgi:hypothetical protein